MLQPDYFATRGGASVGATAEMATPALVLPLCCPCRSVTSRVCGCAARKSTIGQPQKCVLPTAGAGRLDLREAVHRGNTLYSTRRHPSSARAGGRDVNWLRLAVFQRAAGLQPPATRLHCQASVGVSPVASVRTSAGPTTTQSPQTSHSRCAASLPPLSAAFRRTRAASPALSCLPIQPSLSAGTADVHIVSGINSARGLSPASAPPAGGRAPYTEEQDWAITHQGGQSICVAGWITYRPAATTRGITHELTPFIRTTWGIEMDA